MSACRYCSADLVWVPMAPDSVMPFDAVTVPRNTQRVILTRHDCPEREKVWRQHQQVFAQSMLEDPRVEEMGLMLDCELCKAPAGLRCLDWRKGFEGRENRRFHQPRLEEAIKRVLERDGPCSAKREDS